MTSPDKSSLGRPPRICVIGSVNMDLVIGTPRFPAPGETIIGGPFAQHPGGKGANQAVAAARLGAEVSMIGAVGQDGHGERLNTLLAADCIDTTRVAKQEGSVTGVALITVDAQGENTIIVTPGANAAVTPHHVDDAEPLIAQADCVVMQLEVPIESVLAGASVAHRVGTRCVLNAAPSQDLPDELLSLLEVLIVNRGEAAALAGMPCDTNVDEMAAALISRGPRMCVITLGADGALAYDGRRLVRQAVFEATPVDTTAAGDAFVGGFAVAVSSGALINDALAWGCAAGALATTCAGAQPSLPTLSAVQELLRAKA